MFVCLIDVQTAKIISFFLANLGLLFVIFPLNKKKIKKNIFKHLTANAPPYSSYYIQCFGLPDTFFKLAEKSSWVSATQRAAPVPPLQSDPRLCSRAAGAMHGPLGRLFIPYRQESLDYLNECKAVLGPDWGAIYLNQVQRWILCEL